MVYGQPLDEIPCPVSPEDDSARMEFETQAMNHIFDGLSETARATINERARGKSFAEVGIALGVTEVKARDTFHNAIKKIQKELKDKCPREISL